ncbi:MAG: DegV family protein [Acidimicrobiales bacterium]
MTDSAASLPPSAIESLSITVVPMTIAIGDDVHNDGKLEPAEVLRRAAHLRVTTSAPSPGAYLETLEHLAGHPVLVATVARGMSASYQSAITAAGYARSGDVAVVDTQAAAGAQGLVVIAAARAARAGSTLQEAIAAARRAAARVRLLAVVEQLDFLAGSGRVPGIAVRAGRSIGLCAMFELSGGHVRPRRPVRSVDAAVARIVTACRADALPTARLRAVVLHAEAPRAAHLLFTHLHELAADADAYTASFSSVLVAHTGPGVAGLAWWWEPPPRSGHER